MTALLTGPEELVDSCARSGRCSTSSQWNDVSLTSPMRGRKD